MEAVENMSLLKREIRPLFVILIVVIVVSFFFCPPIMFPHQGSSATRVACISNLRQLALGFTIYAMDYDETGMRAEYWHSNLMPYVRNINIFRCPKAVRDSGESSFGYAYNVALSKEKLPAKERRESIIVFFDSTILGPDATGGPHIVANPGRHAERNGFGYLDGKAKAVSDGVQPGSWTLSPTR